MVLRLRRARVHDFFSALPKALFMPSLESIMADYLQRVEAGAAPSAGDYLQRYPEHADELRDFFDNQQWLDQAGDDHQSLVGRQVGPYLLEAEIARGGMGVVYRARQSGLERPVAVKLIGNGCLASPQERRRFRTEAEAAARLRHPGIVPIHDVGNWQGYAYFSMALLEGPTLQRMVDGRCGHPRQWAALVRDIARAVHYAHQQGVVHRDLKPENILTDAEGRPLLTDFGLAKWRRNDTVLTQTGQILGTPAYMSPEQASGRADTGPATDIYSLGAILYALLTGRPPHEGSSVAQILLSVQQDDPLPPRQLCRDLPLDLQNICMRCLQRDPARRYATAEQLADDLQRFLDGEAVHAAQSGWLLAVARSLERDQHQEHFRSWGRGLFLMAVVILVAHGLIFALGQLGLSPVAAYWAPRLTMFAGLLGLLYHYRGESLLPHSAAERPVWSIWIGYLITLGMMNLLLLMGGIPQDAIIPVAAALSGFGFIAMGGHVWGACTLLGLAFQATALLAATLPEWAPLLFGSSWFAALSLLAYRYRGQEAPPRPSLGTATLTDKPEPADTIGMTQPLSQPVDGAPADNR